MHEGPEDSVKKYHAGLSEQLLTMDMWTDILRKTLVVVIISFTVWISCALLRFLVGVATGWLFETAEKYSAVNAFLGVGFILTVMFLVGIVRGLLTLRPAWKDAEGDGVDKALVSFHQTYDGDEDDRASFVVRAEHQQRERLPGRRPGSVGVSADHGGQGLVPEREPVAFVAEMLSAEEHDGASLQERLRIVTGIAFPVQEDPLGRLLTPLGHSQRGARGNAGRREIRHQRLVVRGNRHCHGIGGKAALETSQRCGVPDRRGLSPELGQESTSGQRQQMDT